MSQRVERREGQRMGRIENQRVWQREEESQRMGKREGESLRMR